MVGGDEAPQVTEERAEPVVRYGDLDAESSQVVVVAFPRLCGPGEQPRNSQPDAACAETLLAGSDEQTTVLVHRQMQIHREMLVSAEVVHNRRTLGAVGHRCVPVLHGVEPEGARECDGLPAEAVAVGVVLDRERDVVARSAHQDVTSRTEREEWPGEAAGVPDTLHPPVSDAGDLVGSGESA